MVFKRSSSIDTNILRVTGYADTMASGGPALFRRIVIGGTAQPPLPVVRLCYGNVGVCEAWEIFLTYKFHSHFGLYRA